MKDIKQIIFEGLMSGKIDETVGIELLQNIKEQKNIDTGTDIAIIGLSAKFPLAESYDIFSENMRRGRDCISSLPLRRFYDIRKYFDYCGIDDSDLPKGGYLDRIDCFDYNFFHMSVKEASLMDPHQRLFLQAAWEAIDDAGYGNDALKGSKTGVYVGFGDDSYYRRVIQAVAPNDLTMATIGNIKSLIGSRISFLLDLKGPNMLVNTACSSYLVALNLACQSIRNRECNYALVGGVKIIITPSVDAHSLGIESNEFRIKTFDDNSDGIVWGEGVGAILIKSLDRAIKDGDNIYAVIKGCSVNNDGKTIGLTAPSVSMQEEVLHETWKEASIEPEELSYIEAHGTGTPLGDSIEVSALQNAFKQYTQKKQFCAIGSVKTSIGHLDHAAGMAGLINAILAIQKGYFPVSLHLRRPNRDIQFLHSPVFVNTAPGGSVATAHKRKYGVSGFGLSGTNCHVVLEESPSLPVREEINMPHIFTVSACTLDALQMYIQKYIEFISTAIKEKRSLRLADLCFTASTGRSHYQYRVAIITSDIQELHEKLQQIKVVSADFIEDDMFFAHRTVVFESKNKDSTDAICLDEKIQIDGCAVRILDKYQTNEQTNLKELLYELCVLYVQGADIDWKRLYKGSENRRVSLPSYPFEMTRCWPEIPERNYDDFFYRMAWRCEGPSTGEKEYTGDGKILIITDTHTELTERLHDLISNEKSDVSIMVLNNNTLDTGDILGCMSKLAFEAMQIIEDKAIKHIIFCVVENENVCGQPDNFRNIHFLRFFVKEIERRKIKQEMRLTIIAPYANAVDGSEESIQPMSATLFGFSKIIEMENLLIVCQCVDIDNETTAEEILAECFANSPHNKIALRRHMRYTEEFTVCNFSEFQQSQISIQKDGVYILAGGLGGIGLEVAGLLALHGAGHIVMLNRREIPTRDKWDIILENREDLEQCNIIEKIRLIENAGAKVHCFSVDISNQSQVEDVLRNVRFSLGQIKGVVHSAGLGFGRVGKKIIEDQTEQFEIEASPKMKGTWNLDHATRADNLDFFIMFSSPITVTGGVGVGSYITGNAFQSAYAAYRNKLGLRTLAVGWAPWNHTIRKLGKHYRQEQQLFLPLSNFHGMECLKKVVSLETDEIIIGQINSTSKLFQLKELLTFSYSEKVKSRILDTKEASETIYHEVSNTTEVKLCGREDNQYLPLEQKIAQVWAGVFNLDTLSIDDNYYELGGDSIIAITLINRLNQVMGIHASPVDVLKQPILASFTELISVNYYVEESQANSDQLCSETCVEEQNEYYEASSAQKRIYILSQLNPNDTRYNEPIIMILHGHVDCERVQVAFDQLIQRHEILRTSYHLVGDKIMQKIHDIQKCPVVFTEVAEGENESYQDYVQNCIKPFDLAAAPLFRVHLRCLGTDKYLLFIDVHHSITDGRSSEIMINDFFNLYQRMQLPKQTVQYKEYAHWHNSILESVEMEKQESFWLETLKGEIPVLGLPCRNDIHLQKSGQGGMKITALSNEQSEALKRFAVQSNTTAYNVFLSVLYVLLYNYSGQEDIWIGTPVSERHIPWVDQTMGFIINSIVLRNFPKGDIRFRDFLSNVSERTLDAFANQNYPFDKLVDKIAVNRDVEKNPLFDVMLVMQKSEKANLASNNLEIEQVSVSAGRAKVDLTLGIREYSDYFELEFEYASELFDEVMIKNMMHHYITLLQSCVNISYCLISELPMMEKDERDYILYQFNRPFVLSEEHGYPIFHILKDRMREFSQNTAIVCGNDYITYADLELKVNSLAYELCEHDIGANDIVAILLTDQVDIITSFLATMRVGAAFLVIDSRFPSGRVERLLYDANPTVVLTCDAFMQQIIDLSYQFIKFDEAVTAMHPEPDYTCVELDDVAYVIYTSGTTGMPKGILVSNRQLCNQILASLKAIPYHAQTKHIFTIDFSFDPFIQVILCILCSGGCLHLVPKELIMGADSFYRYVEKHDINSMDMVPSLLSSHLAVKAFQPKLKLDILTLAGEVFSDILYQKIKECFDVKALFNVYGPAETVVNTTIYQCSGDAVGMSVPIGQPMLNYCVYILDKHMRPLPINVEGEIYISGHSVSLGYLNQQEQTNEKFIENPFIPGLKMYRTGDIGKWLPGGNIVFVGRNDSMVKIRGIRMEVHEIQKVIQGYSGVKSAVVIPYNENQETYLCAYIVKESDFSQESMMECLHNQLPDYMIPAYFVYLQELPYNMNGKLDIKNLPNPKMKKITEKIVQTPKTPLEETLFRIWAKILNVSLDFIEPNKSFFDQGGNSLSIILLQKELEQEFSFEFPIADLFSYSTINTFASYLQKRELGANEENTSNELKSLKLPDLWVASDWTIQNKDAITIRYDSSQIIALKLAAKQYGISVRELFLHFYGYALADATGLTEVPIIFSREKVYRQITICLSENDQEQMHSISGLEDYSNINWKYIKNLENTISDRRTNSFYPCYQVNGDSQSKEKCEKLFTMVLTENMDDELLFVITYNPYIDREKVIDIVALFSTMLNVAIEENIPDK